MHRRSSRSSATRPRHGRLPGEAALELAERIADDGYDPETILAIARGGLLVGAALGYALGIKNVYTMNVEYSTAKSASGCHESCRPRPTWSISAMPGS